MTTQTRLSCRSCKESVPMAHKKISVPSTATGRRLLPPPRTVVNTAGDLIVIADNPSTPVYYTKFGSVSVVFGNSEKCKGVSTAYWNKQLGLANGHVIEA
ncbi:hypothetical protein B566_EDAN013781 [Ephemera danica]|nr:hypothetical protein B566_EDAN013781 [Ephemera danica]